MIRIYLQNILLLFCIVAVDPRKITHTPWQSLLTFNKNNPTENGIRLRISLKYFTNYEELEKKNLK